MKKTHRTSKASGALVALTLLAAATVASPASADAKKERYVYIVSSVEAAKGVVNAPADQVRDGLSRALADSKDITGELPADAPDPQKAPAKFKQFLKKKKLAAFRVNVEIIAYEKSAEKMPRGNQRVGAHINIRIFGETIPDRVMAFAGEGSATVKLDVGKKVRPADEKAANAEAISVAVNDAIAASLTKLSAPAGKSGKSGKSGKKKKRAKK